MAAIGQQVSHLASYLMASHRYFHNKDKLTTNIILILKRWLTKKTKIIRCFFEY